MIRAAFGWSNGLCQRYIRATDSLVKSANTLQSDLQRFKEAPDPFAELVSTVRNNYEFERFRNYAVDKRVKRV